MSLDPIITVKQLEKQYRDFLNAQFCFRNPELSRAAQKAIQQEADLFHGPYIEASMPYTTGSTLKELVQLGKLNAKISTAFSVEEYSVYKRYKHQEKAFRLLADGRNIVVSSGTGSGKTECFLVPIINYLLNEYDNGTLDAGVRAILVYPMNALANDQMDRFRIALKNLQFIKFGRYIGETPSCTRDEAVKKYAEAHNGERPLDNEMLTREEMHNNPPHILVTNYAMLEYMLLRPEVNTIFQGEKSGHFKFIVLDEAHTYHGAHGTEVAMLIRRLKERIFGKSDDCLQAIATSATLGGGEKDLKDVAQFASQLFSEKFTQDDIILSERDVLKRGKNNVVALNIYRQLLECYNRGDKQKISQITGLNSKDVEQILYEFFINDALTYQIRQQITGEVLTIGELAEKIAPKDNKLEAIDAIVSIVELCSKIIDIETGLPLINAKYHVFARSLEGGFVSLYPEIKVFTERHKEYNGSPVYEIMNCVRCGKEHILGYIDQDKDGNDILCPSAIDGRRYDVFMITSEETFSAKEDDDEWESELNLGDKAIEHWYLCPKCGKIYSRKELNCCGVDKIHLIKLPASNSKNLCLACGRNRPGTLKKMITGDDASTEILTRTLYQLLPAEKTNVAISTNSGLYAGLYNVSTSVEKAVGAAGRKLLMFSDSRQEAARFAMFLDGRYNEWLWKNLIWKAIKDRDDEELSFDKLVKIIIKDAQKYNLFDVDDSFDDQESVVATQLMKELIEFEPRISLEGLGLIDIHFDSSIIDDRILQHFNQYGFSVGETRKLYEVLFSSLRKQGAVQFPESVSPNSDAFSPRNKEVTFKRQGGEKPSATEETIGWLPSLKRNNRRLDYVRRILLKKGYDISNASALAEKVLKEIYPDDPQFISYFKDRGLFITRPNGHISLNYKAWRFAGIRKPIYICNKCGRITTTNIEGVCEQTNCDGQLILFDETSSREKFYRDSYRNMQPISMAVAEHTAQLTSDRATQIQNEFKKNKINILSCSTTFEMGVDIGSLESVVLRNVPPETANYVQRAGRAGRRNSSAALILTFVRRRSHDLTFFANPQKMIKGIIQAPYLTLDNEYLIKRHLQSVVMSYFFRKCIKYYGNQTRCLINDNDVDANIALYNLLIERPKDLLQSMNMILPNPAKHLFDLNNWKWVGDLVNLEQDDKALFDNALLAWKNELLELKSLENDFASKNNYKAADYAKDLVQNHEKQELIGFLSTNGIIPRYGFPVDVVPLKIQDHSPEAKNIDLSRDLRMAITEYGPNCEVVAGNKIWRPYALRKQSDRKWPTKDVAVCSVCNKIYSYNTVLGEEVVHKKDVCCGKKLRYFQVVKPIFGFTTKRTSGKAAKKSQPDAMHYSSTSYFQGFSDRNLIREKQYNVASNIVLTECAPQGKMLVINNGVYSTGTRRLSFKICPECGYFSIKDNEKIHQRADGKDCCGKLKPAYLGHDFNTDVLLVKLPYMEDVDVNSPTLLYSLLEGASAGLDIDRRELGGAVWSKDLEGVSIVMYDTVPGGAGHVKKIQENFIKVLHAALDKVSGKCGCGDETSCYGCLRNYDNQAYHDILSRGAAKEYFTLLLQNE